MRERLFLAVAQMMLDICPSLEPKARASAAVSVRHSVAAKSHPLSECWQALKTRFTER
jgi:hypothetical protein